MLLINFVKMCWNKDTLALVANCIFVNFLFSSTLLLRIMCRKNTQLQLHLYKGKGKVFPLQGRCVPEGKLEV